MTHTVYALVDPNTHRVRYVGQTQNIATRYRAHSAGSDKTTRDWVRSLAPLKPVLIILDEVDHHPLYGCGPTTVRETTWLKRFRRTVLNKRMRRNSPETWDRLTNPGERGEA